jgi:hypothetical protein
MGLMVGTRWRATAGEEVKARDGSQEEDELT